MSKLTRFTMKEESVTTTQNPVKGLCHEELFFRGCLTLTGLSTGVRSIGHTNGLEFNIYMYIKKGSVKLS